MAVPSNVRGLLFHAAEHATRHVGQIITTAKIVTGFGASRADMGITRVGRARGCAGGRVSCRRAEVGTRTPARRFHTRMSARVLSKDASTARWVANAPVEIRTDRTRTAPVAFTVGEGEKVTAVNGVVITTRPGRVEFDAPHDVDASGGRIHVEPGQTLYLLTSQGEGFMKAGSTAGSMKASIRQPSRTGAARAGRGHASAGSWSHGNSSGGSRSGMPRGRSAGRTSPRNSTTKTRWVSLIPILRGGCMTRGCPVVFMIASFAVCGSIASAQDPGPNFREDQRGDLRPVGARGELHRPASSSPAKASS